VDARFGGLIWMPWFILILFGWLLIPAIASRTGFSPSTLPVYAAAELTILPEDIHLLAPPEWGDYLIYRFGGRVKVAIDTRRDLYGTEEVALENLFALRPSWQATLGRFQFTHALLSIDAPITAQLEQLGWRPLFRDEISVLLERPNAPSRGASLTTPRTERWNLPGFQADTSSSLDR
jgi:hypothetical protein